MLGYDKMGRWPQVQRIERMKAGVVLTQMERDPRDATQENPKKSHTDDTRHQFSLETISFENDYQVYFCIRFLPSPQLFKGGGLPEVSQKYLAIIRKIKLLLLDRLAIQSTYFVFPNLILSIQGNFNFHRPKHQQAAYIKQLEFYYLTQEERKTRAGFIPTSEQRSPPSRSRLPVGCPHRRAVGKKSPSQPT